MLSYWFSARTSLLTFIIFKGKVDLKGNILFLKRAMSFLPRIKTFQLTRQSIVDTPGPRDERRVWFPSQMFWTRRKGQAWSGPFPSMERHLPKSTG